MILLTTYLLLKLVTTLSNDFDFTIQQFNFLNQNEKQFDIRISY